MWWRGQGNSNWELLPSVFRVKDHGKRYEDNITRRFQQRAPSRCAKPPAPNDYFGWLFLMQHYGLPTRLLDWTESPLFATFFATSQKEEGALYALNPFSLNHNQADRNGILLPDNETNSELIQSAFGYDHRLVQS